LTPARWIAFLATSVIVSIGTAYLMIRVLNQQPARAAVGPSATPVAQATAVPVLDPGATAVATPVNAAAPEATRAADATATEAGTQPTPSAQPAPPQGVVRVRISGVQFPGQRTRESVSILNEGDRVDLTGWSIVTADGQNVYTFKSFVLFKDSFITLYSTTGSDSPTSLFWGLRDAVWKRGDTVTLKQGDTAVSTYTIR
jgi:hypothetical protein